MLNWLLMEIQYLGHASFRLKGKKIIVVTDPFHPSCGLEMPRVSADIITVSHDHEDHNYVPAISRTSRREPFLISGPGEYEVAGVFATGVTLFHDKESGRQRGDITAYVINLDGIKLAHLGDLGHKLTDEQLEEINGVDVLFIPVGGKYTIGPRKAVEVVGQIEPRIVIPMHYQQPGLKFKLAPVDDFLKEIGVEVKPVSKFSLSKEKLPEEREVVVFKKR